MKSTVQGAKSTRTCFKKGELVITGYGGIILLMSDQPVGKHDDIHGVVLHSDRNPSNVGRVSHTYNTTSGSLQLFEGKLVLEN